MQMEQKIIGMLEKIMEKQDEHSQILGEHSQKLDEHSRILGEHSQKLDEHSRILGEHSRKLDEHSRILGEHSQILGEHSKHHENHNSTLKEHGQLLSALRSGQEHLKAELDGMKISNAKEFGGLKQRLDDFELTVEILRDESWEQKTDIYRIKNTMGMR